MFTQSPVGLHVLDNQLRVVRMNTGTCWLRDTPVADLLGKRFTEAFELEDPDEELAVAQSCRTRRSSCPASSRICSGCPDGRCWMPWSPGSVIPERWRASPKGIWGRRRRHWRRSPHRAVR
ncbi:PAS domain-containing protein [Streptomyces sp. NPDC001817]|uniref:PAS domain-containing protein n=1 Tax=Streptomyces sp. NPDC001817 TaxID=3154398 RepID=UPI00332D8719